MLDRPEIKNSSRPARVYLSLLLGVFGAGFPTGFVCKAGLTFHGFFVHMALVAFVTPYSFAGFTFETCFAFDDFAVDITDFATVAPGSTAGFALFACRALALVGVLPIFMLVSAVVSIGGWLTGCLTGRLTR